jgi:hypothetical protein
VKCSWIELQENGRQEDEEPGIGKFIDSSFRLAAIAVWSFCKCRELRLKA